MNNKKIALIAALLVATAAIAVAAVVMVNKAPDPEALKEVEQIGTAYNNGDLDGAISSAESLVAADQTNVPALLALAASYAQKGSVTFQEESYALKAIETANLALKVEPNNAEAYRIIGYAYEISNDFANAITNYEKAIELDPNYSQPYSNLGHAYDLQGDLVKAREWYEKALAISPTDEHALLNMARTHARAGEFDDARATASKVIATSNSNRFKAEAYQILGFLSLNNADYTTALNELDSAIALDATVPQVWVMLGRARMMSVFDLETDAEVDVRLNEAWFAIRTAISLNPNQAAAYYLGYTLAQSLGDTATAADYKAKALAAIPNDITLGAFEKKDLEATINAVIESEGYTTVELPEE